ncbi:MAG TPA: extracellular solute-binding protein [Pirellulaceae bacterium]|nr:extracellular solute-binding protein [Pirellulaceae bacterium]HMO92994.1 extracellular solute-binding protein [Pirellulaceae bacterium]HMP67928.1 extracellular solute-binding protein [Pirellulaceae bacterium]
MPLRFALCNIHPVYFALFAIASILATSSGCRQNPVSENNEVTVNNEEVIESKITLAIVGEQELGAEIQRLWKTLRDADLELKIVSSSEFADEDFRSIADVDVLIYPSKFKASLIASKKLARLDRQFVELEELDGRDLLRPYTEFLVKHGEFWVAVSLGEPQPVLLYRKDIFAKHNLRVPNTWEKYVEVAKTLSRIGEDQSSADEQSLFRTVELHTPGDWLFNLSMRAGPYFLTQGRYSTFFDVRSMEPYIASPAFIKGMEDLQSAYSGVDFSSPEEAYQDILQHRASMVVTWPRVREPHLHPGNYQLDEPLEIGIAPLPGATRRFDYSRNRWLESDPKRMLVRHEGFHGMLASVHAQTKQIGTAKRFLSWLASGEVSSRLAGLSPNLAPTRSSHLDNIGVWLGYDLPAESQRIYAGLLREISNSDLRFNGLPLDQFETYAAELNTAVSKILAGELSIEDALEQTRTAWNKFTEETSIQKQLELFRSSFGLQ